MERLTEYVCGYAHGREGKTAEQAAKAKTVCRGRFEATACIDRLAAYEDTGLTPEQVAAISWVRCSERMPSPADAVDLIVFDGETVMAALYGVAEDLVHSRRGNKRHDDKPYWYYYDDGAAVELWSDPTHWMPLPQPPKEG